jgi:hypothetical protein
VSGRLSTSQYRPMLWIALKNWSMSTGLTM